MPPRRLSLAVLTTLAALLVPAAGAHAVPTVAAELALTAQPRQLTVGPDGNVWVALDGVAKDLARVTPDGVVTEFTTTGVTNPVGIASGPDGNLWLTQPGGVARVAPAAPTTATAFPVADLVDPRAIVAGPDGNLWTGSGDKAIRVTTAGVPTSFPVVGMAARGIARGGDGQLYLADFGGQRIVGLTTAGVPTLHPTGGGPQEVAAGPGTQIGFTDPGAVPQTVGRITPGGMPETSAVAGTDPFGIALGADGAYWIANFATGTLTRQTTTGETSTLTGLSAGSGPRFLTAGPGGTLWVGLETAQKVARITGVDPTPPPLDPVPPPVADTTPPRVSVLRAPGRVRRGRPWKMRLELSEAATLGANWWKRRDVVAFKKVPTGPGAVAVRLGPWRLKPGRYRVALVARDLAGNVTRVKVTRLRVLPRR